MTGEKFYRFRSFNDWCKDRFLSELEDIRQKAIMFVNPSEFNDPFDSKIGIPEAKKRNFESNLRRFAKKFKPLEDFLTDDPIQYTHRYKGRLYEAFPSTAIGNDLLGVRTSVDARVSYKNEELEKFCDEAEVLRWKYEDILNSEPGENIAHDELVCACFVKKVTNIPFWAYYGGNHRGYAIQYEFVKPDSYIDNLANYYPIEVNYGFEKRNAIYHQHVFWKSKDWEHEREHRMFKVLPLDNVSGELKRESHPKHKRFSLENGSKITAIYLGLRFDDRSANGRELLRVAEEEGLKVYKMQKKGLNLRIAEYGCDS